MSTSRRPAHVVSACLALVTGAALACPTGAQALPASPGQEPHRAQAAAVKAAPLANLDHLDFLGDSVSPRRLPRHTTYRLGVRPSLGVLWTYADHQPDGSYRRVGGGTYDPETNTYSQGAFNTDDIARAAVVYLRHWRQTGAPASRHHALRLLRALTYLQTVGGPHSGNFVLWMQPDGTLNRSADPPELPDPSDSGPSYWTARGIWALGEGYAAFSADGLPGDAAFARFLGHRLRLATRAVDREVLTSYHRWQVVDGRRRPAWLIVDGADASAEAVLGLTAYVDARRATGLWAGAAATAAGRLAEGIAALGGGGARSWPFGAVQPWALSRSVWHAWASQQPVALARAAATLDRPGLVRPAVRDTAVFIPHLLTSSGPVNGLLPAPSDLTQIAYGVDSRLQSLLAVWQQVHRPALRAQVPFVAAWYFGANPSGRPMYDPATGVTYDGVDGEGVVNLNSGAESTIHGLLSMLALDEHPRLAREATGLSQTMVTRGTQLVEAEQARGDGTVVTPASAWTGESLWSGGSFLRLRDGDVARLSVPDDGRARLVLPIVRLVGPQQASGRTRWSAHGQTLGVVDTGRGGGRKGASPAPGALLPVSLSAIRAGQALLRVSGASGVSAVDAVLLQPLVSRVVLGADGAPGAVLLHSAAQSQRMALLRSAPAGRVEVLVADAAGRLVSRDGYDTAPDAVRVAPGGFTVVRSVA